MNAPAAPLVARLRAEIADLRQQLAAAEEYKRDAERYRWLRDEPYTPEIQRIMQFQQNAIMDAAIDKARGTK